MSDLSGLNPTPTQLLCTLRDHCRQGSRNTRYQAGAAPYLGRSSTGWIAPACLAHSFDHLVSAREQPRRNSKPNSSRAPQVDNELESSGLFDGKVARLRPLDDLVDVIRGAAEQVSCVHAVAHKASILHIVRCVVDRRDAAFCGDFCYSCSIG